MYILVTKPQLGGADYCVPKEGFGNERMDKKGGHREALPALNNYRLLFCSFDLKKNLFSVHVPAF